MKKLFGLLMALILMTIPLSACGGGGSNTITIATQTYTEVKILAYMYKDLIEDRTDLNVNVKTGLSASPAVINAMKSGDAQLSTLYTGEIFNGHFPINRNNKDPQFVLKEAQKGFSKDPWNFKWFDPLGFKNQYAFAVRADYAKKHNIHSVSDLKKVADKITLGVDTSWLDRDEDGYKAFKKVYFKFGNVKPMAITLVYKALKNNKVDAALVYTTDARIDKYNLKVIKDNKQFFPPYQASTVATQKMLKNHPKVKKVLQSLVGKFDVNTMRKLNGEVSIKGKKPEEVAKEYLKKHGMLK